MQAFQFLRLPDVMKASGLSKSEIYRRVAEKRFPAPRPYKDAPTKRFWLSTEISQWQSDQLGCSDEDILG